MVNKSMSKTEYKQALPSGHRVDDYKLLRVLGVGGFGVTYLAEDVKLGSRVAIKEYLPNEFAVRDGTTVHPKSGADQQDFEWGLKRFLDEARTLAQFHHRNLVRVLRFFEANSTAYFVMEYEEGESLEDLLSRRNTLTEEQLKGLLLPLLDGLRSVHAEGFLHRDIKPSNIFVRRDDESPVLLDFGAARNALGRKSRSMTAVVTPGYSPPEQYESDGEQGPWTDIYALSALCFRAVTGNRPEESPRRWRMLFRDQQDPLPNLEATSSSSYSKQFLAAVDWGLNIDDRERPKSVDEWIAAMDSGEVGSIKDNAEPDVSPDRAETVSRAQGQSQDSESGLRSPIVARKERPLQREFSVRKLVNKCLRIGRGMALGSRPAILGLAAFAVLILVVLAALLVFQEPTPRILFTINNDSNEAIRSVYVSPPNSSNWGTNRLADGLIINAREEFLVRLNEHPGKCLFNIRIVTENLERTYNNMDLCEADRIVFEEMASASIASSSFVVANESNQAISAVFVSSNYSEDWGSNRLTGGGMIQPGREFVVHIQGDVGVCQHDVLIASESGLEQQHDDLDVCGASVLPFVGGQVLTVANEGGESVNAVYVAPDHVNGWGEDRLAPDYFIPDGGEARVIIDGYGDRCLFDVLVAAEGGTEQTYEGVDLCAVERVVFQREEPPSPPLASFTVEVQPPHARVRILNIGPAYQPEMPLPPGEYSVEVSASGYETETKVVAHGLAATVHRIALQSAEPQVGDRFRDCPQCPELVVVPPGQFNMGSRREAGRDRDEGPVHPVTISAPFAIGITEVTFAEWDACIADGGCAGYRASDQGWGRGTRPVVNVSWEDADQYVSWLSRKTGQIYRLPSEAEWEYAARAGTATARYWGESEAEQCRYANGADRSAEREYPDWAVAPCQDGHVHTAPIDGGFAPNDWGLQHMLGNVLEWTADCRNDNYVGAPSDGGAWTRNCSGELVLRGGAWSSRPKYLRSAARFYARMDLRKRDIGFRVARTLEP